MRVAEQIQTILTDRFAPTILEIEDVSHHHAHHAGAPAGGESHFELTIQAEALSEMSRIQAHRAINQALADLLRGPVHALQIKIVK